MKYSYTHNNQKFSVIALRDGRAMEIRRGDMTFCRDDKRTYWASLADWRASWPTGAVETTGTSSKPARHPIIQRLFRGKPASVYITPSKEEVALLRAQLAYDKRLLSQITPANQHYWERNLAECKRRLEIYELYQRGQHEYTPIFRRTRTYVAHDGRMMPVYHSIRENVVFVRDYDPHTKKEVHYTPEQLGITENSTFYRLDSNTDVFVPVDASAAA